MANCRKCNKKDLLENNDITCIAFTKGEYMYFCRNCANIINPKLEESNKNILYNFIQPERLSEKTLNNRQEIKNDI